MNENGFSLMEVIVATVIAAIAVVGLAHTFGLGRGQIDRFETARTALGVAEEQMAVLSVLPPEHPALNAGQHDSTFVVDGQTIGEMRWIVSPVPYDWTVFTTSYTDSLRQVLVEVNWTVNLSDTVRLSRLFPK